MKKVLRNKTALALFSVFFISSLSGNLLFAKEPEIIKRESCEYLELEFGRYEKIKTSLTQEEFEKDLTHLCYLLNTGYAGYEDMLEKGFDIEEFRSKVQEKFTGAEEISSRDFYFAISEGLKPYINDSHFFLRHFRDAISLSTKKICAWSDIYVRKNDSGKVKNTSSEKNALYGDNASSSEKTSSAEKASFLTFTVTESGEDSVKTGDIYTGSEAFLFSYPVKGKDIYRVGIMSEENTKPFTSSFSFNGSEIPVFVKEDTAIERRNNMKFKDFSTKDSAYVELNDFMLPDINAPSRKAAEIIFDKYIKLGKKYNGKKNIILDMRANNGGNATYAAAFLFCLRNNYEPADTGRLLENLDDWSNQSFFVRKQINSPAYYKVARDIYESRNLLLDRNKFANFLEQSKTNSERIVTKNVLQPSKLFSKPSRFKGKLIILNDRNTASAGEFTTLYAKHILGEENVFVLGENTYGMAEYWNVIDVQLPCSKIVIHTSFATNETIKENEKWHGEGSGLYPDWWCTGCDLNETIFMITGDEEMKEKLKNIEFYLL